jgi:hypothetical protein
VELIGSTLNDVFISYSSADSALVRRIAERLERSGLSIFLAPAEIRAGENFLESLSDGLQRSQFVMLFLSESAIDSFWVKREWQSHLVRMARDRTAGLLPILLPGVTEERIDPLLEPQHRLDFRAVNLDDPDMLEQSVATLIQNIRGDLPSAGVSAIGLPFVIFAMIDQEVDELLSGEVFERATVAPVDRQDFARLRDELQRHGLDDAFQFYGALREDWRPPISNGLTIRDALGEVVQKLNQQRRQIPDTPIIRPQFFSEDFLSDDTDWRDKTWTQLENLGCVLVVDAISMFHPLLRSKLERSELSSKERTSIIFLLPISPNGLPLGRFVERHIEQHMPRAFNRFATQLDLLCELGSGDIRNVKRWLFSVLPEVALKAQGGRAEPENRAALREAMGQPLGVGRVVTGRGT